MTQNNRSVDPDLAATCGAFDADTTTRTLTPPIFRGFTENDLLSAKLHPRCIVENLLYADLGMVAAAGGTGKTTALIYEAACIAIGRDLWGCKVVNPGRTLFITAEDSRDLFTARLREILNTMHLTPTERRIALEGIDVWDVSGEITRLAQLDKSGNVVLTDLADSIVAAYQNTGLVQTAFDPVISFGPGERIINDGEQAIVTACRRIVRGLNCCVRLIHHTGKANARNGAIDQYASRGGTALPDGCRMVTILSNANDTTQNPPDGFNVAPGDSAFIMARAKLSYAPPQPNIWVRRHGYEFTYAVDVHRSEEEILAANADKLETFIKDEFLHGRKYTANTLDPICSSKLSLTRNRLRSALALLDTTGRIVERDLPVGERRGKRKTYLSETITVSPDYSAEAHGGIDPEMPDITADGPPIPPHSINPPPYRKEDNGGLSAISPSSVFLNPPKIDGGIAAEWRNSQNGKIHCFDCTFFKTNDNGATGACKCPTCSERRKGPSLIGDRLKECSHFNGKAGRMEREVSQHDC